MKKIAQFFKRLFDQPDFKVKGIHCFSKEQGSGKKGKINLDNEVDVESVMQDIRQAQYYIDRLKYIDEVYKVRLKKAKIIDSIQYLIYLILIVIAFFAGFYVYSQFILGA